MDSRTLFRHLGRLLSAPCHVPRTITDPRAPGYWFLAGRSSRVNGIRTGVPALLPEIRKFRLLTRSGRGLDFTPGEESLAGLDEAPWGLLIWWLRVPRLCPAMQAHRSEQSDAPMRPQPRPRPGKYRTDAGPEGPKDPHDGPGRLVGYRPGLLRESGVVGSCGWWPRTGPVKWPSWLPSWVVCLAYARSCRFGWTVKKRAVFEDPLNSRDAVGSVSCTGDRWEHGCVIRACKCNLHLFSKKIEGHKKAPVTGLCRFF